MKLLRPSRSRSSARPGAGSRGFTLMEVLIVLGLIAIFFAGLGIPVFVHIQDRDKEPYRRAVEDVRSALANARAQAIVHRKPVEFVLGAGDTGMIVSVEKAAGGSGARGTASAGGGSDGPQTSPWGVEQFRAEFNPNEAYPEVIDLNGVDYLQRTDVDIRCRFQPNGTADDFRMVLRSPTGVRTLISVDMITGLAFAEQIN